MLFLPVFLHFLWLLSSHVQMICTITPAATATKGSNCKSAAPQKTARSACTEWAVCYMQNYLSAIGLYAEREMIGLYAGRMILPPVMTSSMRCANQPTIRAVANSGVYISSGMPSI